MKNRQLVTIQEADKNLPIFIYEESEYISNYIRYTGNFYEIWLLRYIKEKYQKNKAIIDIGANMGNHAKYFANFLDFDGLYCFEPNSANFALLCDNLHKKCIAYNCALGAVIGKCKLSQPTESNSGHYKVENLVDSEGSVDMLRLDDFYFGEVTLIKIDVEGYEYNVLLGGIKTIIKYKPVLFIETNDQNVTDLLSLLGYSAKKYFYEDNAEIGHIPTIEFIYEDAKND